MLRHALLHLTCSSRQSKMGAISIPDDQGEIGMQTAIRTLQPGELVPDLNFTSTDGHQVRVVDYQARSHLALIFAGEAGVDAVRPLLIQLARRYSSLKDEETEILLVLPQSLQTAREAKMREEIVFPVLADQSGKAHRAIGSTGTNGQPATAVLLADRFGELQATYYTGQGDSLPTAQEMVDWFRYIELECPE